MLFSLYSFVKHHLKHFFSLFLIFVSVTSFGQDKADCASYHDGTFYSYPKNSNSQFIDYRSGNSVKEIEIEKTDTSFWSVKWLDACTYELKLQSGGTLKPADKQFMKEHSLVYRITATGKDYYTFDGFIDKVNTIAINKDTCWSQPSANRSNKPLFTQLPNEVILKRQRFSDTSKYAVLYVYRSKKINQMLIDYPVYFNDNLLFIAHNKSFAIFKILQEGPASFFGKFEKNTTNATIDFKFGKKYFLKCDIHIGIYAKPDLKPIDEEKGREEFDKIGL